VKELVTLLHHSYLLIFYHSYQMLLSMLISEQNY